MVLEVITKILRAITRVDDSIKLGLIFLSHSTIGSCRSICDSNQAISRSLFSTGTNLNLLNCSSIQGIYGSINFVDGTNDFLRFCSQAGSITDIFLDIIYIFLDLRD